MKYRTSEQWKLESALQKEEKVEEKSKNKCWFEDSSYRDNAIAVLQLRSICQTHC